MDKPRRPGKRAGTNEWERYHADMAAWKTEQQGSQRQQAGPAVGGVVSAAFGITTALSGFGMAAGALPGQQDDASRFGRDLYNSSRTADRRRQSDEVEQGTLYHGEKLGWASEQD